MSTIQHITQFLLLLVPTPLFALFLATYFAARLRIQRRHGDCPAKHYLSSLCASIVAATGILAIQIAARLGSSWIAELKDGAGIASILLLYWQSPLTSAGSGLFNQLNRRERATIVALTWGVALWTKSYDFVLLLPLILILLVWYWAWSEPDQVSLAKRPRALGILAISFFALWAAGLYLGVQTR